mmetsp:Transcript_6669/g.15138  ORF Transcript_6669/g.15138 Transcript_6669/m.15138 type:complete len:997 (-) Transcript_6669:2043-5033(-)|eukprot:CAMPEP_0172326860 /NCGR_PEP_ID=MMETSP1058-20130122/57829_1 /TAXON_ID=83371 /ORGANISM="Detonula confervacea, Strain CCMP 353" /LENGTH=996 /DNA_ID=CAMNT_0013043753 /DNA_START=89 /DNA_END=3079 /DNA_ORIENTATION=+
MSGSQPASSTLAVDVAAAAKALEEVAAAGGAARIVMNREGGASLVIQVSNNNKSKVKKAQTAIKNLTSNSALKAANKNDERDRKIHIANREKMMTPLMKAARDDKYGKEVQKEIKSAKAKASGEMLETILNEKETDFVDEENAGSGEVSNVNANEADDSGAVDDKRAKAGAKSATDGTDAKNVLQSNILPKEGGWAAIHFACDSGNHEGLRYLLAAGAEPNLTERMGATPLHRVILGAGKYPLTQLNSTGASEKKDSRIASKSGGNHGGKMALPGVVKSSSGSGNNKKGGDGEIDTAYLDDYMTCLKLLLDNGRFNLMMNERREERPRASKKNTPSTDNLTASQKIKIGKEGLPKDDGFGVSPLCLCVSQGYTARDALYPLLEHLLTRGFDANATMCGVSALHIALRNAHYGCAFALTRAGANINAMHPDGKTALQASELIYGESFARELREASVVAMAVADPTRRRDMLRSQGMDGAKKLAKRAMNAGHSFIKASRWREAAGAYSEAAAYGAKSLPMRERFECLRNMSECFLQVERGLKSEEVARQLLKEFPKVPLSLIAVGEAMSHPSCGKLSPEQLKEVNKYADDALKMEKKSDGKEWWRTLEPTNRSNSSLIRALKLKGLVEGRTKEQNPAVKVANTALDEYFTPGGSIEKAAFAIELALKPALNHPSPLPLHGIRGFIYYSWASEILRANSLCRSDRERKDGLLRVMAPLKNKMSWKEAQEKIQIAFDEFEYYSKMNVNGEFPKLMYGFNISKTNFALGKFKDGKRFALASIKERAEADLARLDDNGTRRKSASEAAQDDHFEGGSTQKLILQLNWALDMNRMLVTQMVIDYAINADSSKTPLPSPMLLEPMVAGLTLKEDVINMPHLCVILEKAVTYKLLDKASEKRLLDKISGNPIKVNAAIKGLLSAMKTLESGYQAMADLRVEVGKIIMKFVTGAHHMQKQTKSSSRVVGSLLMEALEWDKNVKIPKDLPKMYLKMTQEFTQVPNSS